MEAGKLARWKRSLFAATAAQRASVRRLRDHYRRAPDDLGVGPFGDYLYFWMAAADGWPSLYIGIEKDGYAHS